MTKKNTTFNKYHAYKDSKIDWIGEIPEHWEILPGMSFIYENKEKNIGLKRNTVLSLSYGKIRVRKKRELTGLVPESFETYQLVNKGDLIFRPTDLQNDKVSLRSALSEFEGIITSAYLNLRFKETAIPKFYHYLFRAIDNNKVIYGLGSGLRQNISYLDFKRFRFPFPPLPEQIAIANFLDEKTSKIDEAVQIKEREIELLKERRQIIIQEVVTGKKVWNEEKNTWTKPEKTKDSGVDWIGEIPEDWEVTNLRYAFKFLNYRRVPLSAVEREKRSGKYRYYGASGVIDYIDSYIFNEKTILIAEDGANLLSKSTPLAFVVEGKYWVNNHAHILKPRYKGFRYWAELLSLIDYTIYITGAAQPKLSRENLGSVKVIIPTDNDLKKISEYLESVDSKIAHSISLKEQEIGKLKEYKTILIDSAVTGKIKVN